MIEVCPTLIVDCVSLESQICSSFRFLFLFLFFGGFFLITPSFLSGFHLASASGFFIHLLV